MSNLSVAGLSVLFGFCGVIYEFVFAQSFSILFGQSALQYAVTIGLFLGGMGLGAKISETWQNPLVILYRLQITLAFGVPAVFILVWLASIHLWTTTALISGYGLSFTVGLLTGGELPLLIRLGRRGRLSGTTNFILGADYIGMLTACAVFPLFLLPQIGLFQTLFLAALGNSLGAVALSQPNRARWLMPVSLILAFASEPLLRSWLSTSLIGS